MAVILALKEARNPYDHKKTRNSLPIIQMEKASDKHVGGTLGVNISDVFGGVTEHGLKPLESVENNSSSRGGGWRGFVGPRRLLGKVGSNLRV